MNPSSDSLAYVNVETDGVAERGGPAALTVDGRSVDATFSTLGARASAHLGAKDLKATATLGWRHMFGDLETRAAMAFASGGDGFTIAGAPIAQDAVNGGRVDFRLRF